MSEKESNKKNRKPYTIHKTEILLNKEKLKAILDSRSMEYMHLWEVLVEKYGLDITYKGFMALISNRSAWKLIYAWAITEELNIDMKQVFEETKIDVKEKVKEKEKWKDKYQK